MSTSAPPEATDALTAFRWEPQPRAAAFVRRLVHDFLQKLPEAAAFAERLYRETGNRFADLIAAVEVRADSLLIAEGRSAGWSTNRRYSVGEILTNPAGMFPRMQVHPGVPSDIEYYLLIKVEDVVDFAAANLILDSKYISGIPGSSYRRVEYLRYGGVALAAVEQHGGNAFEEPARGGAASNEMAVACEEVSERFRLRTRYGVEELELKRLGKMLDTAIGRVGRDVACDLFFAAEREYWQRRNAAAQFQKARQDKLGIGWANHDHHTYRSSRRYFHRLVALWEKLGFECRERFYPGPAAGWGAQVMEQPVCGIVTFNDVDISPDELATDFAHEPMEEVGRLATVGLWCALHGESVLQAGMHHLECTFDFDALKEQMERDGGIATMPKFTDFPHLKQAFTKGERWAVDPKRIDTLLEKALITEHQAKEFRKNGAIGSHLENLERNDGFKGFNQTGVTEIIKATDPRRQG